MGPVYTCRQPQASTAEHWTVRGTHGIDATIRIEEGMTSQREGAP